MRKKHPEHVNLERWLVSYADFITLLFAFFVIMYAISQADAAKFKKVSESLRTAFSSGPNMGMVDMSGASGGSTVNPFEETPPAGGRVADMPAGKSNTASDQEKGLQELREKLEETISLEMGVTDPSEKVEMQYDSRGLIVRLAVKDMFGAGEVSIHRDLLPLLDRIGRVLAKTPRLIRIEGHADPLELSAESSTNLWQLSAARAAFVAAYWQKRFEFDPKRLGIGGYAANRPLNKNKSEWDRAANRRIEIIVLNNEY